MAWLDAFYPRMRLWLLEHLIISCPFPQVAQAVEVIALIDMCCQIKGLLIDRLRLEYRQLYRSDVTKLEDISDPIERSVVQVRFPCIGKAGLSLLWKILQSDLPADSDTIVEDVEVHQAIICLLREVVESEKVWRSIAAILPR